MIKAAKHIQKPAQLSAIRVAGEGINTDLSNVFGMKIKLRSFLWGENHYSNKTMI